MFISDPVVPFARRSTGRLLAPLGLLMSDVASPLRRLVASFQLTAQNVTLTPSQWTLAAIVLLSW